MIKKFIQFNENLTPDELEINCLAEVKDIFSGFAHDNDLVRYEWDGKVPSEVGNHYTYISKEDLARYKNYKSIIGKIFSILIHFIVREEDYGLDLEDRCGFFYKNEFISRFSSLGYLISFEKDFHRFYENGGYIVRRELIITVSYQKY